MTNLKVWGKYFTSFKDFLELKFYSVLNLKVLLLVNSGLWDVNRWGPDGPNQFRKNCQQLLNLVSQVLPAESRFLWLTTPPGKDMARFTTTPVNHSS